MEATAVIYARVSSSGYQSNRQDTSRQVEDMKAYADYAGIKVVRVFEEHVSGAKERNERPALSEAVTFCKENHISVMLCSELSRLGRSAFDVLQTVKELQDNRIDLYLDKEKFSLFDKDGQPSVFAPVLLSTLAACSSIERTNIQYRLNSGRARYIRNGGKLGRKVGSVKTREQKEVEYKEAIAYLRNCYSVRITAKLTGRCVSTIQHIKKEFSL